MKDAGKVGEMKKNALCLFLFIFAFFFLPLQGEDFAYKFEKDTLLTFTLRLESKFYFAPNETESYLPLESLYTIKFFVMDKTPAGEALVAASSQLEKAVILEQSQERGMKGEAVQAIEEMIENLDKEDSAAFLFDRQGNILLGRMVWPEGFCYHLSKVLEGLSLGKRKGDLPLGAGLMIDNQFSAQEEREGREFLSFQTENTFLDLKLLVSQEEMLPYILEAEYHYKTLLSRLAQKFTLTLASMTRETTQESFLEDEIMLTALIQAAILSAQHRCSPTIIQNALNSSNLRLRLAGAYYLSRYGIPDGLDLSRLEGEADEVVRLNLAKAELRSWGKRDALERLAEEGTEEVKERAQKILSGKEPGRESRESFLLTFAEWGRKGLPEGLSEREAYAMARSSLVRKKEILHLGPRSGSLRSGVYGDRIFRYNVFLPEDYDPGETYPLLIFLSGGNGFSDSMFLSMKDIVPYNYILVCPDSGYGRWWNPDQRQMFEDLLLRLVADYAVEPDRIYLTGFSNGGIATYLFGFTHPDKFAALASLMGISSFPKEQSDIETELSLNSLNTPILIIHGEKDNVIPVFGDRILADFLRRNDIPHKYVEIPGEGHNIGFLNHHQEIMNFFRRNGKRSPAPERIHLITEETAFNRNFWVRVDEIKDPLRRARVEAKRKGNRFDIKTKNVKRLSLLLNDLHYEPGIEYTIIINRKKEYQGKLDLDPKVLLESFLQEQDYARLYGVRLTFEVGD